MSRRSRILVTDDDRGMRHSILRLLHNEGYDVYGAESGEDAIRQAKAHHPDLVLMDVVMPGMDGVEAARRIKSDPDLSDVFIVHLSAQRAPVSQRMEGLEAGADGYIVQPVENEELISRVRAFLRHKKTIDDLRASETRYRTLYAGNPLPMWIYDCGTFAILDVNTAAIRHFGYSRDEFLKMPLPDLIVAEERESFCEALRDVVRNAREDCWSYRTRGGEVIEIESTEQEVVWEGRAARAVLLNDVTDRNRIDRERLALLEKYEREFRSLKNVSEFRNAASETPGVVSGSAFGARAETFVTRYIELVERAMEQKIYKVEHNVSAELQLLAQELFSYTVSPRDLVELHCAAMKRIAPTPSAPQAQGRLECGRLVIVELMGYVLGAYRSFSLKQAAMGY
jgi:PAS domain S-box-containing protein